MRQQLLIPLILLAMFPQPMRGDEAATPAFEEAAKAMEQFKLASGLSIDVFAAEPQLVNPVALWMDERGRAWVVETYRGELGGEGHGVHDIRHRYHQLDDDLASATVQQRLETLQKWNNGDLSAYTQWPDQLRLIEDSDGNGKADRSTIFAGDFNDPLDGLAAGVITRPGAGGIDDVYFANIPHLWLLRDTSGDGIADVRESLSYGYGVKYSLLGHDLHGLRWGPDGRLYFSIGDRGLHVKTREGKLIDLPDEGAVLRCEPDGSNLELFARGLRNPQKLVFDQYGNLFTGDNNCDHGDPGRWVYVVEGGDTGWRIGYQHIKTPRPAGPWMHEKLYEVERPENPAYLIPPIAHISSGPSGCTVYPGTGLPEKYNGHFFLTDFRAGPASLIHTFALQPKGAGFELVKRGKFIEKVVATDIEFGPDGAAYVLEWPGSFTKPNKGRIYRVFSAETIDSELVKQTHLLLNSGMSQRSTDELASLLAHPDMRVRQAAQFELAARGQPSLALLNETAAKHETQLARIHAMWGIEQIARQSGGGLETLMPLLNDSDAEIRAQAAKLLGEGQVAAAHDALLAMLTDESARVRYFAAMALGKIGRVDAIGPILEMLATNADADAFLRHAGVMGLTWIGEVEALLAAAKHESPAARMGVLLALRKLERSEVAQFLHDPEQRVVAEAARAINDTPIADAYPQLAAMLTNETLPEAITHRALNANFRLGGAEQAAAVAAFAAKNAAEEVMRVEALAMLKEWQSPRGIDRVVGNWWPVPQRDPEIARDAGRLVAPSIIASAPEAVRIAAIKLVQKIGSNDANLLFNVATDKQVPPAVGAAALSAMEATSDPRLGEAVDIVLKIGHGPWRTEAIRQLAHRDNALEQLEAIMAGGEQAEQQAVLAALGSIHNDAARQVLDRWMDKLLAGDVPPELHLDLLHSAAQSKNEALKEKLKQFDQQRPKEDHLANFREALVGGDAQLGRKIFFERVEVSCLRCHKVDGEGGLNGPDLSDVGSRRDRVYLLESLVDPNRDIAPGFENVTVKVKAGKNYSGVVRSEDDEQLVLDAGDGAIIQIAKSEVETRTRGLSPMPSNIIEPLSKREVRDLVEYLASLTSDRHAETK